MSLSFQSPHPPASALCWWLKTYRSHTVIHCYYMCLNLHVVLLWKNTSGHFFDFEDPAVEIDAFIFFQHNKISLHLWCSKCKWNIQMKYVTSLADENTSVWGSYSLQGRIWDRNDLVWAVTLANLVTIVSYSPMTKYKLPSVIWYSYKIVLS